MEGIEPEVPKPWLSRLVADHSPADVQRHILALGRLHACLPEIVLVPSLDERAMRAHLPKTTG